MVYQSMRSQYGIPEYEESIQYPRHRTEGCGNQVLGVNTDCGL